LVVIALNLLIAHLMVLACWRGTSGGEEGMEAASVVFAMTYGGARGNTAAQMARTFYFPVTVGAPHEALARLGDTINGAGKSGSLRLNVANSLWPQEGYPLLKEYLEQTEKYYRAKRTPLNYEGHAEGACRTINAWVDKRTEQKIRDLLKPDSLDSQTRLVLANAVYFKGDWESKFDKNSTRGRTIFSAFRPSGSVTFHDPPANLRL